MPYNAIKGTFADESHMPLRHLEGEVLEPAAPDTRSAFGSFVLRYTPKRDGETLKAATVSGFYGRVDVEVSDDDGGTWTSLADGVACGAAGTEMTMLARFVGLGPFSSDDSDVSTISISATGGGTEMAWGD